MWATVAMSSAFSVFGAMLWQRLIANVLGTLETYDELHKQLPSSEFIAFLVVTIIIGFVMGGIVWGLRGRLRDLPLFIPVTVGVIISSLFGYWQVMSIQ